MNQQNNPIKENVTVIKIDPWSIIKIILIFLALWLLYVLRDVILIILAAVFLAAVITPMVDYFERKKMPRWLGAFIVFLIIFLILGLLGFAVGPTIVSQTKLFVNNVPEFLKSFLSKISVESRGQFLDLMDQWLSKSTLGNATVFSLLGTVTGQMISFFMVFVIAFYLSVEKKAMRFFLNSVVPIKYRHSSEKFVASAQKEIGAWARGVLLLCLSVGVLTYFGLLILRVKFPLTLSIIAGLTEVIPWVGPWLGAVPAVIIALTQSPTLALLVIILYIVVQQIENMLVLPHVMHRAVGLDPLIVVIVLLVGGKIAGPIGMILSVPIATIIAILIRDYLKQKPKVVEG